MCTPERNETGGKEQVICIYWGWAAHWDESEPAEERMAWEGISGVTGIAPSCQRTGGWRSLEELIKMQTFRVQLIGKESS